MAILLLTSPIAVNVPTILYQKICLFQSFVHIYVSYADTLNCSILE